MPYRTSTKSLRVVHLAAGGPEAVKGPGTFHLPLVVVPAGEHLVLGHAGDGTRDLLEESARALHQHGTDRQRVKQQPDPVRPGVQARR